MIRRIVRSFAVVAATTLVAVATTAASQVLPGDQSRWSLDFHASMEQSSAPKIEMHLTGGWTSTISAVRDGEYDAQLQLADLQFSGDAVKSAAPDAVAALRTRLSRPIWATYRRDGALVEMHFLRDMSPADRNLLQMIATELQMVQPETAVGTEAQTGQKSWTAQERDGAGEYSALYVAQANRILKRKLKYLYTDGVAGAPADAMHISVEQSEMVFSVTPDHHVQAMDGTNRVRMSVSLDKSQELAASTEFHASHLQTGQAPELVGGLARAAGEVVHSPIVTQRPDADVARAEADDRLLKGYTTDAVFDSAFAVDSAGAAQPDRLTALFRRRPEAAPQAEILLIKNGPRKTVTNALGASGSPTAVTVLSELAHNANLSQELRVDAILAFVQMKHPTAEAMQVPSALIADPNSAVRSAARMISGALSRQGRPEHQAEANAMDASLLALFQNAQDAREKTELLGALGNSAGPATLQTIEQALSDPSVPIRAAAARALRLAADTDADRSLATVIVNDRDPAVRADAIFATRFRHPLPSVLQDALLRVVHADQLNYVRGDAIAVLSRNRTASPRISEALAQAAQSDPDSGIRRQAKLAIEERSTTPSTQP